MDSTSVVVGPFLKERIAQSEVALAAPEDHRMMLLDLFDATLRRTLLSNRSQVCMRPGIDFICLVKSAMPHMPCFSDM